MSVFEEKTTESQPQETVATEQNTTEPQSYVQKLVHEKGDVWSDPEVIAKGKIEGDTYIKTLERQLEEMRADLNKQEQMDQILSHLQGKAPNTTMEPAGSNNEGGTTQADTKPEISEDVLKSLVEKTLSEREAASTQQQNLDLVNSKMEEFYGTDAKNVVNRKAEELGMSVDDLRDIATRAPDAFFTLVGEPGASPLNLTRGSVNTNGLGNTSSDRDFSYYQKMRRENRSLYYTPKMQQQMMEDRMRLGDRFGG